MQRCILKMPSPFQSLLPVLLVTVAYFVTGRLGLLIHSTAGYVDPGWEGNLTLELSNVANLPITLYDGMKIGQISFQRLSSPAEVGYGDARIGSKYRGQRDPTASLYHRDFERGRIKR